MKLNAATITLLLAGFVAAYPQNRNGNGVSSSNNGNSNNNGGNSNNNGGNSNNNGGNSNNNGGNSNNNNNGGNTNNNGGNNSNNNGGNNSNNNGGNNSNNNGGNNSNNNGGNNSNNNGGNNQGGNNNGNNNNGNGIQDGSNDVNQPGRVNAATAQLMQTAIDAWQRDTGVVSNFLNQGASYPDDQTFRIQAQIAHSAEVDELTHKAVLDQNMGNNRNVQQANATLTNGAFQLVVDQLQRMADQGRQAMDGIDIINKDRCVNVLPNIDTYMRESANAIGNGQVVQQSVRPAACGNISPGTNGALQINQPPPGYVNGKLQNEGSNNRNNNGNGQNNNGNGQNNNGNGQNNNNGNNQQNNGQNNSNNGGNTQNNAVRPAKPAKRF